MNKDIVKNAVICLANMKIEDTTFDIARDIVIDEFEEKDKEIERLNNIIKIKNDRIQQLMKRTRSARIDKAIGLIYDYQMNDKDNVNYKELLFVLKGSDEE